MSDGGVPRTGEGIAVTKRLRQAPKPAEVVGLAGADRVINAAYIGGAFDQGAGTTIVVEPNPRANSVVKSDIPADQFDRVKRLFTDPNSEKLKFISGITEDQINQCDVPEPIKAILRQALNGSRPGAKVDSTW